MDLPTILSLLQFAIQEEPAVADSLRNLFGKGNPVVADWDAEIARVQALNFKQLVPNSDLPDSPTPPTPPAAA
jgi:hypothetical protein